MMPTRFAVVPFPIRASVGAVAALLVLTADFALADDFDPFLIPRDRFERSVRTIAIEPLILPLGTPNGDAVRRDFESRIEAKLRDLGYGVVPASEFELIWRGMSESVGGAFDARSGAAHEDRFAAVHEHAMSELRTRFGVDAVLAPSVRAGSMQIYESFTGSAIPGGEKIFWEGKRVWGGHATRPQLVIGNWLGFTIYDLGGAKLYSIRSVLEWTEIYAKGSYERRDASGLFQNDAPKERAVEESLDFLPGPGRES
jgi:hypothetical protein